MIYDTDKLRYHAERSIQRGEAMRYVNPNEILVLLNQLDRARQDAINARDDACCARIERDALAKRLNGEGVSHDNTMTQRDYAEEMADKLSLAIVGITGRDIGEHSSANCPWRNAVEFAEEYESERDGLQRLANCRAEQRDALAAHVERCQKFLEDMHTMPTDWTIKESQRIHEETPETSLAQLKAQWQAEALDDLASGLSLNADNARENGYAAAADTMQDAADYALTKSELLRQARGDV